MKLLQIVLPMITILVLCFPVIGVGDQTDQRLNQLFQTLQSSQDATVLVETEATIWEIWYESGQQEIDDMMLEAAVLVRSGDLAAAESAYSRVIDVVPGEMLPVQLVLKPNEGAGMPRPAPTRV